MAFVAVLFHLIQICGTCFTLVRCSDDGAFSACGSSANTAYAILSMVVLLICFLLALLLAATLYARLPTAAVRSSSVFFRPRNHPWSAYLHHESSRLPSPPIGMCSFTRRFKRAPTPAA
jgi:hypothetical protein